MSLRSSFDVPTTPWLSSVLNDVQQGRILIPRFQRPFEWDDERRLKLLDSVYQGLPIGSFLLWLTRKHTLETFDKLGPFSLGPAPIGERRYLIDGHQRLTTLYSALTWTDDPLGLKDSAVSWPVYFDLKQKEFQFATRSRPAMPHWLPLSRVLDAKRLYDFQKRLLEQGLVAESDLAEEVAGAFRSAQVPLIPLVSEDLDLVTEAFVRVNRYGKKMGESHMIRALMYREFDLEKAFKWIKERLEPEGWNRIDDQIFIGALKLRYKLDVYKAEAKELHQELRREQYERPFQELAESTLGAVRLLNRFGIRGPEALPYAYQLVILIDVMRNHPDPLAAETEEGLHNWVYQTAYTGYFTGMVGAGIQRAADHVLKLASGAEVPSLPPDADPRVESLTRFAWKTVRTRVYALFLARQVGDSGRGNVNGGDMLGELGVSAVGTLLPGQGSHPANRVVAPPESLRLLRARLTGPDPDQAALDWLNRWGIPEEAVRALHEGDQAAFLELRRVRIEQLEREWVQQLGLQWLERRMTRDEVDINED